ncbi:MAG TPA: hypothetical protein VFF31_10120 [Blastocatellia bacterium]|nr:hypothetical protein [Blastocatellia bacterium]
MKRVIASLTTTFAVLGMLLVGEPVPTFSQETSPNRNGKVKTEMKQSGKEMSKAGKSLGENVKHGRVARGGKQFGKHTYRAGKHFGKGSKNAAKKTGKVIKNAAKP